VRAGDSSAGASRRETRQQHSCQSISASAVDIVVMILAQRCILHAKHQQIASICGIMHIEKKLQLASSAQSSLHVHVSFCALRTKMKHIAAAG
jgi:hypothetical protein